MGILNLNVAVSRNSSGAMIRIFLLPSHQGLKKKIGVFSALLDFCVAFKGNGLEV